jgi:uncharacterized protein YqhQ
MKNKEEDEFFRNMMAKSELQMNAPDFEDKIMRAITEKEKEKIFSRNIWLSGLFFVISILLGLSILFMLPHFRTSVWGAHYSIIAIAFVLFLLLQLDSYLSILKNKHLFPFKSSQKGI